MPMQDEGFVCGTCGSPAIETWPFVHCYKCGAREDRPDLGQNADGTIMDQPAVSNVVTEPNDPSGVTVTNPGGNPGSDPGADPNADPSHPVGDPLTDPTGDLP